MTSGLLLGIFTGQHAGSEALFEAGEYVIGSALDCDVVLMDGSLAPHHCSFSLAEDGAARLSPLEGALTLAGEKIAGPMDWPAGAPVLAGLVCLAWTRPGEGWAGLRTPSLLSENRRPLPAAEVLQEPAVEFEPAKPAAEPAGESGRRPLVRWLVLGAVVLSLVALIMDLAPAGGGRPWLDMEQILEGEGLTGLRVERGDGRVMVYGLAPTEAGANRARELAAGRPYPVQVVVRGEEEFIRAIQGRLAGYGLFPQVRIENGEAELQGYALDSLTENAALSWARSAGPRVAPIRSALLSRSAVEETLAAELDKAGLRDRIAVDWRPGVIALSGPAADKTALAGVMEAVRGALGSPITFQLALDTEGERIYVGAADGPAAAGGPRAAPRPRLEPQPSTGGGGNPFGEGLSLRGVTPAVGGAGLPFITTSDGAVYFLGGILPGGYTLTGIFADRLEFSRDGTNMAYKMLGR